MEHWNSGIMGSEKGQKTRQNILSYINSQRTNSLSNF